MNYLKFALVAILTTGALITNAVSDDATRASSAPSIGNASVVESDHGQGLGPNGADLHVNPETESSDAELLQNSLQDLPELQVDPPLDVQALPVKGEVKGKSDSPEIDRE